MTDSKICGTCYWCGERDLTMLEGDGWLRCELFPRTNYRSLLTQLRRDERELLLELLGTPTAVTLTCQGWTRRMPPGSPPRRT